MIFNGSKADSDRVSDFLELAIKSATSVDKPLTLQDALIIAVDTLCTSLNAPEDRIAQLERTLANFTTSQN